MMWRSKKNPDDGEEPAPQEDRPGSSSQAHTREEPNERTRLLDSRPPPPNSDGYLDPDDPAVSPYNLWSVRFLRYFTVLFLVITFLWWVLLLVSIFISPPGMHSRGSGFFDFSYTTLTIGNLLVAVVFFIVPAKGLRITTAIVSVLLLVDMIMILSVPRLRVEEGWVGIASVIWATVMAIWCILTDRVVAWGKREEEERLTGRPETRRTVREWTAVLIATIITSIFIVITLLMTGTLGLRARDATLAMTGDRILVDGDKYEVHLACLGSETSTNGTKEPTILIEAGEHPSEYGLEPWAYNAWQNGTISRYCYWDRPGYGWSDNAPSPHSAGMSADALSEALAKSGEQGPWVLVSAGYGSVVSRIFSSRHLKEVSGLMLLDPLHEDLLHRIGSPGRGFLLWGWGIISPLGIERLGGAIFKGRTREDRVYGKYAYQNGRFIKAQLQENLVANSLTRNEVRSARNIQSPDTPLVLITSGIRAGSDAEWESKQRDLSKLTDNLLAWDTVPKAPHEVWKTLEGRTKMEDRLKELVAAARNAEAEKEA
ncbi:mitochondrial integral membrane protein-like protein [Sporormia fimetaria CBS 119925]|uniref:Mitochondrial integral membrane protein-like protein n=1 Tax=Sporormia fimetaria CBS 119925 TaxID=1340428 RepID=A0A6A6VNB3_9PLEO|nr:mitochondrial integral membrane protein-like protein [Sporormia fimetaria CBS 119925]